MKILITGGAGFIGSSLIRHLLSNTEHSVINIDKLTYAGCLSSLEPVSHLGNYGFELADVCDTELMCSVLERHQPDTLIHLAAESHVDRSINAPGDFIHTNIVGVYSLLEAARWYYHQLSDEKKPRFRFHHVSTDEVYGSLDTPLEDLDEGQSSAFVESSPYRPNSPYSASKASADHLVRAWHKTYELPTIISNCSNNYGPYQFPEKLIPLMILNALEGKELPLYGDGQQVRDWIYVDDHVKALLKITRDGRTGETYNISAHCEKTNLQVVHGICEILDKVSPKPHKHEKLVKLVEDRPGHDFRYALNASKSMQELNWRPLETFESGLYRTVNWYLKNQQWCNQVQKGTYSRERLGLLQD